MVLDSKKKYMNKILQILIGLLAILTSSCNNNAKGTFEVGQNTFLLNGEPFVVKAAELHYPRIPRNIGNTVFK